MPQSNDKYRVMFENMAQGAYFQSADGALVEINAAALEMVGLSREEFLGRTCQDPRWRVIREDGSELSPEQHPSMVTLRTGQPVVNFVAGVYSHQHRRYSWLNINVTPMFRKSEATPYQVFVTLHDISEQKRINDVHLSRIHLAQFADSHPVEELFVEVLDELEKLTDSAIGFYHLYDEDTRCVAHKAWSTKTATLFCRAPKERGHYSIDQAGVWVDCILQREVAVHNDYASLAHKRGLPEGHAPITRELVVPVKRNGRIVAILGIGNKLVEYSQADVDTVTLFADLTWEITERKKMEALLHKANRELEILTSSSMEGYWVFDAELRIISANDTCCQMYGYSREEMLTKTLRDIEAQEDDQELQAHTAAIMEQGYDRFETQMRHKSGRLLCVEVSAAYLPESGLLLAFNRDITVQKSTQEDLIRSREKLKRANDDLEQHVAQRTADLQRAIAEQESFSYSVSHDLRAPLRHINSFSAILQEDFAAQIPEQARGYLDRICTASSNMGKLIDHLLEMSRVDKAEIKPEKVDLSKIAAGTLRMLQEADPHRQVELSIEADITAYGDRQLLRQLLWNLLGNAWKYTSRTPSAHISLGKCVVSGQGAYFVKDNGAGFDMAYKENLFKVFQRLHGAEYEGVGIGLATALRIVRRHGGDIWADGAINEGATFYFALPAHS